MEGIILIGCIMGGITAAIAASKGRNPFGWFFVGFLLGLIGVIIALVMSNLNEERAYRRRSEQDNRRLREQLHQERMKNEAFRQHTVGRLDAHDQRLGLDTRTSQAAIPLYDPGQADEPSSFLSRLEQNDSGPAQPRAAEGPAPRGAARQWHYERHGQAHGPVSEQQLRELFHSGQLDRATLVWTEQLDDWTPAGRINVLKPHIR